MAAKIGSLGSGLSKNVRLLLDLAVLLPLLYITSHTSWGSWEPAESPPVVVSTRPYGHPHPTKPQEMFTAVLFTTGK